MQEYTVTIDEDGTQRWYQNEQLHRLDGPAVIYANGSQFWCQWCQNGLLHRLDGPAVICATGAQRWYQNGLLHRLDGPAVIGADGTLYWFLEGVEVTQEQHTLRAQPAKELTVAEIEALLGYAVRVVK